MPIHTPMGFEPLDQKQYELEFAPLKWTYLFGKHIILARARAVNKQLAKHMLR